MLSNEHIHISDNKHIPHHVNVMAYVYLASIHCKEQYRMRLGDIQEWGLNERFVVIERIYLFQFSKRPQFCSGFKESINVSLNTTSSRTVSASLPAYTSTALCGVIHRPLMVPAWLSNYIHQIVRWNYPSISKLQRPLRFGNELVISYSIPHFIGRVISHPCWD